MEEEAISAVSLIQVMKIKNRIIEFIQERGGRLHENSHLENTTPKYSVPVALEELKQARKDLVDVKMLIFEANEFLQVDIFTLAELKGSLNDYKRLNTFAGPKHRPSIVEPDTYVADVSQTEVEETLRSIQKQINDIQDKLDESNATIKVHLPTRIKEKY